MYMWAILGLDRDYLGGCQNYGPLLGTLNIRCRTIIGIRKGTMILTTTHIRVLKVLYIYRGSTGITWGSYADDVGINYTPSTDMPKPQSQSFIS